MLSSREAWISSPVPCEDSLRTSACFTTDCVTHFPAPGVRSGFLFHKEYRGRWSPGKGESRQANTSPAASEKTVNGHLPCLPTFLWNFMGEVPDGSVVKSACQCRGRGSIPGSERSPGGGHGTPLQCPCLENPMDGGAWWATAHGVTKSRTRLRDRTTKGKIYDVFIRC